MLRHQGTCGDSEIHFLQTVHIFKFIIKAHDASNNTIQCAPASLLDNSQWEYLTSCYINPQQITRLVFSLKAILPLQVLNFEFLVVASGFGHAYIPNRPCTTMVSTGCEWRNNWRPGISQGNCVKQHCTQHCSYKTIHGNFSCPPPVPCFP